MNNQDTDWDYEITKSSKYLRQKLDKCKTMIRLLAAYRPPSKNETFERF